MRDYGCDLALGTAEFWASRVTFNESLDHYEIKGVIGPGNDYKSDNNLYTNVAAAMNLFFGTWVPNITLFGFSSFETSPISTDTHHAFAIIWMHQNTICAKIGKK